METTNRDVSPNKDTEVKLGNEQTQRADIIYLPPCKEGDIDFVNEAWRHFDPELYRKNLQIVKDIIAAQERAKNISDTELLELKLVVANLESHYSDKVDLFASSAHVTDALRQEFPGIQMDNLNKTDIDELTTITKEKLQAASKETLLLSSSHLATYAEIKAAKELNPDAKIGLVIYDRHADFYYSFEEHRKGLAHLAKGKHNFLVFLLEEGLIDGISIVGFPAAQRDGVIFGIVPPFLTDNRLENMRDFVYQPHREKITLANEDNYLEYTEEGAKVDNDKYTEEVKKQVAYLQQAGVTNLVVSVDPDVLPMDEMGLTAMEYNPVSDAISIGIQDFSTFEAQAVAELTQLRIPVTPESIQKYMAKRLKKTIRELTLLPDNLKSSFREAKSAGGYGLPLDAVTGGISIIKQTAGELGMQVGVLLPNGGSYVGGITELSAYDFEARSARAMKEIASAMLT